MNINAENTIVQNSDKKEQWCGRLVKQHTVVQVA